MEESELIEMRQKVAENRELEKKLTKKNDQFVFDLKKALSNETIDEEKKARELNDMLHALVEGQKTGVTAKQLYGTPQEAAHYIVEKPEPLPEVTFGKMWLDNTLLLFTFLAVMTGVLSMVSKTTDGTQGIVSLILGAMSGGLSFYFIYRYIYIYDTPGADQSKRPGIMKTAGIMALCFMPWLLIFSLAAFIPSSINPALDPVVTIVLGALVFGLRYVLKKKYGLQGSLSMRR